MESRNHILLLGAGKSATVLIDYLKEVSQTKQWRVTVADINLAMASTKTGEHEWVKPLQVSIIDEGQRQALVQSADLVISLLPPALHGLVAKDCLFFHTHLLTASYIDAEIAAMTKDITKAGLLFLCEMGLDPGIDHMSAMQLIHRIKDNGGHITSFASHCGGLVAPESDNNPWHYKIIWNPKNIVLAGKTGAVFRKEGIIKKVQYGQLFNNCEEIEVQGVGNFAYYPNRDSLHYADLYQLEEAKTFIRTTLRHPAFCRGWKTVIDAGLTDEETIYQTDNLSISAFLKAHFDKKKISLSSEKGSWLDQFRFLGFDDDTMINKGPACSAEILQWIIEKKWGLAENDKDMVVMQHEIAFEVENKKSKIKSGLVVKGENHLHTAMAKTVGLPLGIAAVLVLDGKIMERGLHLPTVCGIYEPVLAELQKHGIVFEEVTV